MPFDPDAYLAAKTPKPPTGFDPDQYLQAKGISPPDNVIEEMHPDITMGDRFKIKNFSNDPKAAAEWLAQQHPGMEVKAQPDGRIIARNKGEKDFRVLDPDAFKTGLSLATLKDLPMDALDMAYDVPAGALQGLATAASGVAGAPTVVGALPAAAAGGAASGAGLETLRQAIGKALGVNKEMSGGDIALSGTTGAVAPLLFGAGAGAKSIANGLGKEAIEDAGSFSLKNDPQALLESQKGLLARGIDKLRGALPQTDGVAQEAAQSSPVSDFLKKRLGPAAVGGFAGGEAGELVGGDEGKHKGRMLGAGLAGLLGGPKGLAILAKALDLGGAATGMAAHQYETLQPAAQSAWSAILQHNRGGQ